MKLKSKMKNKTKTIQVSNIAPQATKDQLSSLFAFLGKIEDIRLFPTIRDVAIPVQSRICFIKFCDRDTVGVAQHLTNVVFIDRALLVLPYHPEELPDETRAIELLNSTSVFPALNQEVAWPEDVTNEYDNIILKTKDPKLENNGLPEYPNLPATTEAQKVNEIRRTLVFDNLPLSTTIEELEEFANEGGPVRYLRLGSDSENSGVLNGLVEFCEQSSIPDALRLHGKTLNGNCINVNHSTVAILKPTSKTNEAAVREIEDAMNRVKQAQSMITTVGMDPLAAAVEAATSGSRSHSRQRTRSVSRKRSRSKSRSRRRRSRSRSRRRSGSRYKSKRRSRSRSRSRRKSRSKSKKRSRSRSRSRSRTSKSSRRDKDRKRSRDRDRKDKDRRRSKEKEQKEKKEDIKEIPPSDEKKGDTSQNMEVNEETKNEGGRVEEGVLKTIPETEEEEQKSKEEKIECKEEETKKKENEDADKKGEDKSSKDKKSSRRSRSSSPRRRKSRSRSRSRDRKRRKRSRSRRRSGSRSYRRDRRSRSRDKKERDRRDRDRKRRSSRERRDRDSSRDRRDSSRDRKDRDSRDRRDRDSRDRRDRSTSRERDRKDKDRKERRDRRKEKREESDDKKDALVARDYDEEEMGYEKDEAARKEEKASDDMDISP